MRKNLSYQSFLRVLAALLASLCVGWSAIAQERGYDLDLKLSNATVKSFTDAFSRQTGVAFSFGSELAGKELGDIEVQASSKSLESILEEALSGTQLVFKIAGNQVALSISEEKARTAAVSSEINGLVTDSSGQPLPGVGIQVVGTTNGTISAMDGSYSLKAESSCILEFSCIGYRSVRVPVGKKNRIDVVLEDDTILLEDAVVVGYGTQSRKTLTTSISKVDGNKLVGAPVSTVGDALKGKVTGLRVASNNNLPGEAPRFLIRGGSSINRSNDPLCLVDGVERSFAEINPNDIESIEVLKDAASAAIYGSRASNGVIIVTTRKGDAYKKPNIVFDAQVGFTSPARRWNLANSREYLTIVRPAALQGPNSDLVLYGANGAGTGNVTETAINSTRYLADGEEVPAGWQSMPDPIDPSKTIIFTDHDWQSDWYDTALYHKEYIGINGGNQNMKYAASIGYLGDEGMVAMSKYKLFTMHGNTSFKIVDGLEASTTFDFSNAIKNPLTGDYFACLGRGLMMSPTHIGKYTDGTFATGGTNKNQQSAEFYETFYDRETVRNKFMGTMNLRWSPVNWFDITAQYTIYDENYRGSYYAYGEVNGTPNYVSTTRSTTETRTQTMRHDAQIFAVFKKDWNEHRFDATVGADYTYWRYWYLNASNTGSLSDKVPLLQSGGTNTAGTMDMSNKDYAQALLSFFARASYNYADRYVLSATFRADGSSKFLGRNKWGYFPSASAAWIISEEPFFASAKSVMNNFKLRVSVGQTGNNDVSLTAPLGAYAVGSYDEYTTLLPSVMQNMALRWETTTQTDVGIDMGFLRDRIRIVMDGYTKLTTNLLYNITLPDTGQLGTVMSNVGSVRFSGFEFELHTVNFERKNFTWETDITYSYNRNRVISLPDEYKYTDIYGNEAWRIGGYTASESGYRFGGTAVGEPLGRIWGYKVAGILQTDEEAAAALYDESSHGYRRNDGLSIQGRKDAGDFEWVNREGTKRMADGSEMINAEDMFCLGNIMPHSTGGINNSFSFYRFRVNVYLDFALGHSIYNYMKSRFIQNTLGYSNSNVDVDLVNGCWRYPGDTEAKHARFFPNDADYGNRNFSRASTFNVERADYLCIRDISLYYDLPDKWAAKAHMKKITIGVSGNTLHYFTGVSGNISPETGMGIGDAAVYSSVQMGSASSNITPPAMKILFNVKLTF